MHNLENKHRAASHIQEAAEIYGVREVQDRSLGRILWNH